MLLHFFSPEGTKLGGLEVSDGAVPREGEVMRIHEGPSAGDYLVEHVRWDIPLGAATLCIRRVKVDTWPDFRTTPQFPNEPEDDLPEPPKTK